MASRRFGRSSGAGLAKACAFALFLLVGCHTNPASSTSVKVEAADSSRGEPAPSSGTVERPPAAAERLQLTWLVHDPTAAADHEAGEFGGPPERIVELRVAFGDREETIELGTERGMLSPLNQSHCHRLRKAQERDPSAPKTITFTTDAYEVFGPEVAKITFYEGGARGYSASLNAGDLEVRRWSQSDGACDDGHGGTMECPRDLELVRTLSIGQVSSIDEAIFVVGRDGSRQPYDCSK